MKHQSNSFKINESKKIAVIGISGSGKTTFSIKLSKILNIPVIHVDEYIWGEDWKEINLDIAEKQLKNEVEKDKWIIEGYLRPVSERLVKADLIIYLDFSGLTAVMGGLKRWWKFRGSIRPEFKKGCVESKSIDWEFMKVMFTRSERPEIENAIMQYSDKLIRLKSKKEMRRFIQELCYLKKK